MTELPEGFDLQALLAPIGDNGAGEDLREDYSPRAIYYRLRDARAEARAIERQLDGGPDPENPVLPPTEQWGLVRTLSREALTTKTKDLEIAAWMTEALLRSHGLAGFTLGCQTMHGLVSQYWETLYPRPDEDGIATTVGPVTSLNGEGGAGTLVQPLRMVRLFARGDGAPVALYEYEASKELATIQDPERRQARLDRGIISFETLETEARARGPSQLAPLRAEAAEALAAWQALSALLDEKAGADSPPTSRVRDLIEQILEFTNRYAPAAGAGLEAGGAAPGAQVTQAAAPGMAGAIAGVSGPPASREEALRQLQEIATFFRHSEPQSPLAYTLQDAVRRGRLSWPDLLAEVVPDSSTRHAILTALGIKPPDEDG